MHHFFDNFDVECNCVVTDKVSEIAIGVAPVQFFFMFYLWSS